MRRGLLVASLFSVLSSPLAAGESMGPEVVVHSAPGCPRYLRGVTHDSLRDQFLLVWEEACPGTPPTSGVFARLLDRFGLPLGAAFEVTPTIDGRGRLHPAVAYQSAGDRYLVVYSYDYAGDGSDLDIRARFLRATGVDPAWGELALAQSTDSEYGPDVAYSAVSDRFVVAWTRSNGASSALEGRRVAFPDETVWIVFDDLGPRRLPDLAFDPTSNTTAVAVESGSDIYLRRVLAANGQVFAEQTVSSDAQPEAAAAVASCGGDQFLVSWEWYYGGSDFDLLARFFQAGVADGASFVIANTTGEERTSEVACLDGISSYLVTFSETWGGGARGISARRVSAGKVLREAFAVRGPVGSEPLAASWPAVAGGRHGWLVAWNHQVGTAAPEIHARVVWELFVEGFEWGGTALWSFASP